MKVNPKVWLIIWGSICLAVLCIAGCLTVKVDPFFHYHKPNTEAYFYPLNNERSQNNGIVKRFDYDALITGTSMTENFKTSEAEELFGGHFIKVPFSGASFKEVNDNLKIALEANSGLKMVIRGLDLNKLIEDKDLIREDLGEYPTYLYDQNLLNDVKYVFNRDVFFGRVCPILKKSKEEDAETGFTSFDKYMFWNNRYTFGIKSIYPDGIQFKEYGEPVAMTEEERKILIDNIRQNVTDLADDHPEVTFYYFFTPFSAGWWKSLLEEGSFDKQLEAEKITIEEILQHENILLFSFNNNTDMITDLNNYKDERHYGAWVNSYMLKEMSKGQNRITRDNYQKYLEDEKTFYASYDYTQLKDQKDYKDDKKAARKMRD